MTELHQAVISGDFALVQDILRRDPSRINDRGNNYQQPFYRYATPLHVVYEGASDTEQANNRLPILRLLLDYGADVNARNGINSTPLFNACANRWNQIEGIKLLLDNGSDPNVRNHNNHTALLHAVAKHGVELVELLLEYQVDVNAVGCDGSMALDVAICKFKFDVARVLVNAGAKARDIFGSLLKTIDADDDDKKNLINFLIQHGTEIDFYGKFSPRALYFAWIKSSDAKFIEKIMLERGIDVEELKRRGNEITELHVAAQKKLRYGRKNIAQVRALLGAGADVNAKTVLGETPLHLLLDEKKPDDDQIYKVAKLLIEAGADCNARECFGYTPIQKAVFNRCYNIVKLMLARISGVEESKLRRPARWAEMDREHCRSFYPLAIAIFCGYKEVVDRLIEMGHHTEAMSHKNFLPPLYYGLGKGTEGMAKMLLEAGCRIEYVEAGYCTKNFETLCLLWEYDCILFFLPIIMDCLILLKTCPHQNDLVDLIIFYYKIGLNSNKLKKDFFSMTGSFYSDGNLSSRLASYDDQIEELKNDMVCCSLSKYDLLTRKIDSFVTFLNDENNLKACQELRSSLKGKEKMENYDYAIKVRIDLATEKRLILDRAKDCLNQILQDGKILLSDEIVYNILSYLNIRELKKMSTQD